MTKRFREYLVIPDTQVKDGVPTDHLAALGNYAAERRPDVIVHLGDHWDMPSLSAWDSIAKKVAEKHYYLKSGTSRGDVEAGNDALAAFMAPILRKRSYAPKLHLLRGNHENRIMRRIEESPELGEAISDKHLKSPGWTVHPFLVPVNLDGILFSHYFCVDANGRVLNSKRGQASAKTQVKNVGQTCIAGHKQGLDTAIWESPGGRKRGIIAGSFYQHDEDYLSPQGQAHWRGALYLHEVHNGDFDLMELSLDYLRRKWA